jgi:hypothetical protein
VAFNTTSYLAGVGSVVAALTIGFSSGFFFAAPTQNDPPNRLQRVASTAPLPSAVPVPVASAQKQEIPKLASAAAAPTASAASAPEMASTTPVAAAAPPSTAVAVAQQAAAPQPPSAVEKSSEPPAPAVDRERLAQISAEKITAAEASRAAERKRVEARKLAERQRRQREVQEAAAAVKRMARDHDVQQVADRYETGFDTTPRFGFFGQ